MKRTHFTHSLLTKHLLLATTNVARAVDVREQRRSGMDA